MLLLCVSCALVCFFSWRRLGPREAHFKFPVEINHAARKECVGLVQCMFLKSGVAPWIISSVVISHLVKWLAHNGNKACWQGRQNDDRDKTEGLEDKNEDSASHVDLVPCENNNDVLFWYNPLACQYQTFNESSIDDKDAWSHAHGSSTGECGQKQDEHVTNYADKDRLSNVGKISELQVEECSDIHIAHLEQMLGRGRDCFNGNGTNIGQKSQGGAYQYTELQSETYSAGQDVQDEGYKDMQTGECKFLNVLDVNVECFFEMNACNKLEAEDCDYMHLHDELEAEEYNRMHPRSGCEAEKYDHLNDVHLQHSLDAQDHDKLNIMDMQHAPEWSCEPEDEVKHVIAQTYDDHIDHERGSFFYWVGEEMMHFEELVQLEEMLHLDMASCYPPLDVASRDLDVFLDYERTASMDVFPDFVGIASMDVLPNYISSATNSVGNKWSPKSCFSPTSSVISTSSWSTASTVSSTPTTRNPVKPTRRVTMSKHTPEHHLPLVTSRASQRGVTVQQTSCDMHVGGKMRESGLQKLKQVKPELSIVSGTLRAHGKGNKSAALSHGRGINGGFSKSQVQGGSDIPIPTQLHIIQPHSGVVGLRYQACSYLLRQECQNVWERLAQHKSSPGPTKVRNTSRHNGQPHLSTSKVKCCSSR